MRVITGGQIGVDLGAWRAARNHGLPTGGWMPCGYQTEVVAYPEFARNCWAAEGTLLVAGTRESKAPGISEYAHRFMSMVFEAIPREDNP